MNELDIFNTNRTRNADFLFLLLGNAPVRTARSVCLFLIIFLLQFSHVPGEYTVICQEWLKTPPSPLQMPLLSTN